MDVMLSTCEELAVPVAPEKVSGPTPVLEFLGVTLDTLRMVIRLPQDKFDAIQQALPTWLSCTSCRKRELLSLIGTLSFACRCIPAGRIFLRRMIDLSTTVSNPNAVIHLSRDFRLDVCWWRDFLPSWNGSASLLQPTWSPSPDLQLYTNASGTLGCGGYYSGQWFTLQWPRDFSLSIAWKELYPIFLSCSIWGNSWHGSRVLFHCDNETVVNVWKKGTSRCPAIMDLVRRTFFCAAKGNFTIAIRHIRGINNNIADSLSRLQMHRFRRFAPHADAHSITIDVSLRPEAITAASPRSYSQWRR